MNREIIKIDEEKCNGCGICVPNCHEGALQIIDGKARLISELFCDGLGACIGDCPQGAISIEEREAEAYDEKKVMEGIVKKGDNTILAHLKHLKDHNQEELLMQAIEYLKENEIQLNNNADEIQEALKAKYQTYSAPGSHNKTEACQGGCPGSIPIDLTQQIEQPVKASVRPSSSSSELRHWPVQLHLINPSDPSFKNTDLLLSADCVAYTIGDFHNRLLKNHSLAISCPKLDSGKESYVEKITQLIDIANVNTITLAVMEVPCCNGLMQLLEIARSQAKRYLPVRKLTISVQGEIIQDIWIK